MSNIVQFLTLSLSVYSTKEALTAGISRTAGEEKQSFRGGVKKVGRQRRAFKSLTRGDSVVIFAREHEYMRSIDYRVFRKRALKRNCARSSNASRIPGAWEGRARI
jgi:hypothetical protein